MESITPRYSREVLASRGEMIFARDIEPQLQGENPWAFVLIDIETGDYGIDAVEMEASERLFARKSNAQIWMRRVGSPYTYRFGARPILINRANVRRALAQVAWRG